MREVELRFSKKEINQAGRSFREESGMQLETALEVLNNFRAAHSFPMQVFYMRLKRTSESLDDHSLVAQRLKRTASVVAKLRRRYHGHEPSMDLFQMQDIGGCRAILSDVALAQKLADEQYITKKGKNLKHKLVRIKNYIDSPKSDGYRGIHLVYSYKSEKLKKKYDGLFVEIQIRSKLQHAWATAVETVDFFTRQAIKSNEGAPEWMEFFKLVSSAFAKMEGCPTVVGTPQDDAELYAQIAEKERQLIVIDKMKRWTDAMRVVGDEMKKKEARFFLLELDIENEKLTVHPYTQAEMQKAIDHYAQLERRYTGNNNYDVVLAGVEAARDLQKAYPNYYVDMTEFVRNLEHIIKKAQKI